jgi:hypothetical protein
MKLIQRLREAVALTNAANFTTTVVAATTITGLSFSVIANEVWVVKADLTAQCSSTGGIGYAIAAPAGSVIEGWVQSSTSAILTLSYQRLVAINTLTATALHTVATTPGPDRIFFVVTAGATGTVALQAASKTAGQTTTVFANSSMITQRAV